jgi:predicted DNA-binding transcriptional regulator AlpA
MSTPTTTSTFGGHDEPSNQPRPATMTNDLERYLTKPELAAMFKVTTRTIDSWQTKGLPFRKLFGGAVRFKLSEIQEYFDENWRVAVGSSWRPRRRAQQTILAGGAL